jgi:thioredoxin-related protein
LDAELVGGINKYEKNMRKLLLVLMGFVFCGMAYSQDLKKFNLYKPEENAEKLIDEAVEKAKDEKKHVFIQVGGNWCIWCARFNDFVTKDKAIDSLINKNYVVYHLNWSKENKNASLLKKYKFPQRFGYPVFLVLNGKGDLIHTQSSWYLESGKSYDKEKVVAFFNDWTPKALDPSQYKEEK